MIKAIIFDLDDTLFSSSKIATKCRKNAVKEMVKHGLKDKFENVYSSLLKIILKRGSNYNFHFNDLLKSYNIKYPEKIIAAGVIAYHKTKMNDIETFEGVHKILSKLKKLNIKLILMTNGRLNKQWEKILLLKLDKYFDDVIISDKQNQDISKLNNFKEIIKKYKLNVSKTISVGDRLNTEIKAGNELGMITVRILKGKYKHIKSKKIKPDFIIKEFKELLLILQKLNKSF